MSVIVMLFFIVVCMIVVNFVSSRFLCFLLSGSVWCMCWLILLLLCSRKNIIYSIMLKFMMNWNVFWLMLSVWVVVNWLICVVLLVSFFWMFGMLVSLYFCSRFWIDVGSV